VTRGAKKPLLVEDKSKSEEGSGAVVPMPTLFCAFSENVNMTRMVKKTFLMY
jgi:hypothetical protein